MKTPNSKEINQFTRGRIIGQSESGISNCQIGRNITINHQTVNIIVNKLKSEGHCIVEWNVDQEDHLRHMKGKKTAIKRRIIKDRRLTNSQVAASFENEQT